MVVLPSEPKVVPRTKTLPRTEDAATPRRSGRVQSGRMRQVTVKSANAVIPLLSAESVCRMDGLCPTVNQSAPLSVW
jgi:hypothetical protein